MVSLEQINRYRRAYKNWISVMWNVYKGDETINAILKNGKQAKWPRLAAIGFSFLVKEFGFDKAIELIKTETILYKNKEVVMHGIKYGNGDIIGVYMKEDYRFLNVNDQIVIDIGANIGDSSIYFVLNGAKKVIALEPYPYSFKFAEMNVKENKMDDKITLLNVGYGNDNELNVDPDKVVGAASYLTASNGGVKIKLYSLKTLLKEFGLDKAVLKMDCEGCEYNLLNEDCETLRHFKQIQIEFHYGYRNLMKKLEDCGFKVHVSDVRKSGEMVLELRRMAIKNSDYTIGWLYAELNI